MARGGRAVSSVTAAPAGQGRGSTRVPWLDGIRGAAAIFVVLHHMWLTAWPGFPSDNGPWWLGWLLYGHMAVAIFIVVSGFSLALAPMRNDGALAGGVRRFLRRNKRVCTPPHREQGAGDVDAEHSMLANPSNDRDDRSA